MRTLKKHRAKIYKVSLNCFHLDRTYQIIVKYEFHLYFHFISIALCRFFDEFVPINFIINFQEFNIEQTNEPLNLVISQ